MPKYLFTIAAGLLLSGTTFAQSLNVNDLIKLTEAKPDSVAAYLQTKQFKFFSKSTVGAKSFVYRKTKGKNSETLAKTEDINRAGERLSGVTYMVSDPLTIQDLIDGLNALDFKITGQTIDAKKALTIFKDNKYEARISIYNDSKISSSITLSRADKRMLPAQ